MEMYQLLSLSNTALSLVKIRPFRYGNKDIFEYLKENYLTLKSDRFGMEIKTLTDLYLDLTVLYC